MDYHSVLTNTPLIIFLVLNTAAVTVLIFVAMLLLFLSFLVAGSEVAFFSLNNKDINVLKTRQQPSYRRIVSLLEQPKTLLASMLIANSFLNIAIILISNILINNWLPTNAAGDYTWPGWAVFAAKLSSVAILIVLFAEVMPKVWATHHKVWFASTASLIIEIFNSIFYGLSKRLVRFNDNIEKRLSPESDSKIDESNLDYAIDLLPDHEATTEEKQILKGIHKFGNTSVKQIMRTRMDVSGIPYTCNFDEVKQKVEELHYSRIPVYKNNLDEIAGIVHTKDLLQHLNEPASFNWHELMRTPYFVHEQKFIEDLLQEFRSKRVHFAVVVDEFGGTSGIVTLEDIMEEIIGDINDEFDDEESVNKKLDDNNYIFEGKMMINDACKAMGLSPDTFDEVRGESDSVAGLVLEIAGEFPQVNDKFESGDFTFIPLSINRNRIDKVQVTIARTEI
ncbi:MAG: gliding motility-associated protein GldE [Ferruginibacter sp.]